MKHLNMVKMIFFFLSDFEGKKTAQTESERHKNKHITE